MRITPENWKDAERDIKESGIQDAIHDAKGFLQTVITKKGVTYEFSPDVLMELIACGLIPVKLGRKVEKSKI